MKHRHISSVLLCLLLCTAGTYAASRPVVTVVSPISAQRILPDTREIIGIRDHHLYIAAAPGEYENCSFVVTAASPLKALNIRTSALKDRRGNLIKADQIDVKAIKCWYQDLGAGYRIKVPDTFYDPMTYADYKVMVPELLLNDSGFIKVDTDQKMNYMRVRKNGSTSYELLSGSKEGQGFTGRMSVPVDDAPALCPLPLDKGRNQQYYVTVHLPYGTRPGIYRGKLTMTEADATLLDMPLTVRVLPIRLPERGHEISSIYYNMPYDRDNREELLAQFHREVASLKRHGIDNPQIGGGSLARWNSGIVNLKDLLLEQKAAGIDITTSYFFMVGYHAEDSLTREGTARLLKAKKMAEEAGVKNLYIYSHDEALAHGIDMKWMHRAMEGARKLGLKPSGAGIPVGFCRDERAPGNLGFLGDVQDLFICLGYPSRKEAAEWHKRGQKIISYGNPMHGLEQPDAYRRNYGILLWQYDYDGACNYAQVGPWGDFFSTAYKRHAYAYATRNGFIETVQFEGYREGVDDVRYIKALGRDLSAAPAGTPGRRKAQAFFTRLRKGDINKDVKDSNLLRLDIIGHLLALKKENN